MSTNRVSFEIEVNIHVLPKSTGVVISVCSCIAKTLQNCIGLQKNVFGPVEYYYKVLFGYFSAKTAQHETRTITKWYSIVTAKYKLKSFSVKQYSIKCLTSSFWWLPRVLRSHTCQGWKLSNLDTLDGNCRCFFIFYGTGLAQVFCYCDTTILLIILRIIDLGNLRCHKLFTLN